MFYKQDSAPPTKNFRVDLFDKEGMQTPGDMTKEAPRRDLPNAAIFVGCAPLVWGGKRLGNSPQGVGVS